MKINSCEGKHSNCLDVYFTNKCNNSCSFCIDKNKLNFKYDQQAMVDSVIASGKDELLILGGEPLIDLPKILSFIRQVRDKVKKIYITTSLPDSLDIQPKEFFELVGLIDGLNISVNHPDEFKDCLSFSNDWYPRHTMIKTLANKFPGKIRINLNLIDGLIDSPGILSMAVHKFAAMKVGSIKINELQNSDQYVSYCVITGRKLPSAYLTGCQTDESDFWNSGTKVEVKRSCFKVLPDRFCKVSFKELVKFMLRTIRRKNKQSAHVLFSNGRIGQW